MTSLQEFVYVRAEGASLSVFHGHLDSPTNVSRLWTSRGSGIQTIRSSPDGRWLAYSEFEGGRLDVFVRALQNPDRRVQLTKEGGDVVGWGTQGREVFYVADNAVWSLPVTLSQEPTIGTPTRLFRFEGDVRYAFSGSGLLIRVMPDGNHFVALERELDPVGRHLLVMRHGLPKLLAGPAQSVAPQRP